MPRPTIRPAQSSDFHPLQAMSCSGEGSSCYPSFCAASHKFFVAEDGHRIVGFICAYPTKDRHTSCVQMLEPYLFNSFKGQGIEDDLKAAVLEWAEERLDVHFFKDNSYDIHPIKPHEYIESLKYDGSAASPLIQPEPVETPVSQPVYIPERQRAYG